MDQKLTFYIVRHGKTLMNTLDRVQGWCDSPLTREGIEMARHLGYGLDEVRFRSAYCSDLRRTRQTAEIILGAKGQQDVAIEEYAGFREVCFGSGESSYNYDLWGNAAKELGYDDMHKMFQDVLDEKCTYDEILKVIKGFDTMDMAEDFAEVEARTQEQLREVARREIQKGSGNILVVAHGMCIICMLYNLGGKALLKNGIENASVCKVEYQNGEFTVVSMNDTSYRENGRQMDESGMLNLNVMGNINVR